MLKKTLLVLVVVVGLVSAVLSPTASAGGARRVPGDRGCPPGFSGDGSYCEHVCIVPQLVGDRLLFAYGKAWFAGCRIGEVHVVGSRFVPGLWWGTWGLLTVVAQDPAAGTFHRFRDPVTVWVRYGGRDR